MTHDQVLARIVLERSVIVCTGPGGVGKTTVAASLALAAAALGRRACVVTVDPARRLADALGADVAPNVPHEVPGPWRGRLTAVMLEAAGTFDEMIGRYAESEEQAERVRSNRLYRNLVGGLSGTQEYMATERLFELHERGEFDLIVVDTPPSRHALDFLSAPQRLAGFLDNRVFRLLISPGRATIRAVGVATHLLLRTIARVAGSEIVDDTIAFFQAFEGMEQGFRDRAAAVERLLQAEETSFVLVTSAQRAPVEEARWLAEELDRRGRPVEALVVNRVLPLILLPDATPPEPPSGATKSAYAELVANAKDLEQLAEAEAAQLGAVGIALGADQISRVPLLEGDVHDLGGLAELARLLVGVEIG